MLNDKQERALVTIFTYFNIVDISLLRTLNRIVNYMIMRTAHEYGYLSDSDDNAFLKEVPNLAMFRFFTRYTGIKKMRCHGKVNVTEITKYLELSKDTITDLEIL